MRPQYYGVILAGLVVVLLTGCSDDTPVNSTLGALQPLLAAGDPIIAVDLAPGSISSYPAAESPPKALDNNTLTKYLNFGKINSGFIVTPAVGPSRIASLQITTANDAYQRDPSAFALYGTNDPIMSVDNSDATGETWALIDADSVMLPLARFTAGPEVAVKSHTTYKSYLFVVTAVKDSLGANSMQFSEIQFFGYHN